MIMTTMMMMIMMTMIIMVMTMMMIELMVMMMANTWSQTSLCWCAGTERHSPSESDSFHGDYELQQMLMTWGKMSNQVPISEKQAQQIMLPNVLLYIVQCLLCLHRNK